MEILSWNANGIDNKNDLSKYVEDNNISIVCIQEIRLGPRDRKIKLPGFNFLKLNRVKCNPIYGGILLALKKHIKFKQLTFKEHNSKLEIQGVQVQDGRGNTYINIINTYVPPTHSLDSLREILEENRFLHKTLVTGDLNTQHPMWGDHRTNRSGLQLEQFLTDADWFLLNTGLKTTTKGGALDISICTSDIAHPSNWTVDTELFSDHFAQRITIGKKQYVAEQKHIPHLNYNKANWDIYRDNLEILLPEIISDKNEDQVSCGFVPPQGSLDKLDADVTAILIKATKEPTLAIPDTGPAPHIHTSFWWDDECTVVKAHASRARKIAEKTKTEEDNIEYKRLLAIKKRTHNRKIREAWHRACSDINRNTPIKELWEKINKFTGNKSRQVFSSLILRKLLMNWLKNFKGEHPIQTFLLI